MREIRFRAWAVASKKMFYPDMNDGWELLGGVINPLPNTYVMQYTGMKDKNGKRIYEGDIVRVYDEAIRSVTFKNAFWRLEEFISEDVLGGFGTETDAGHKPIYRYPNWGIEVIGNIYENPEKLTK